MELNYTKMRLNIICSSLHTQLLNLRTSQIRVVSVARSGNTRNWMWNHVIFWLYNWGCHLTFQTLLRCEGSPPWASSEYVPRDFCTSPTSVHGSSTSALGELVWWKSTQGGLLVPSSASVQDDWNHLILEAWGQLCLMVTVTFALRTKSCDFTNTTLSLGSH